MIESILLSTVPVATFKGSQPLTHATGFFFEREGRLFLVTSRHVMLDEPSGHFPDRIEIELHTNPENVVETTGFSIPLYQSGRSAWRQATDAGGEVDVAAIQIDRAALPKTLHYRCFTPHHLVASDDAVEIGTPVVILGFPLGFHDGLHSIPVARQAVVASAFGLRFQGAGYFLTDARTHRGTSGSPVIQRIRAVWSRRDPPWMLLGVHSARLDVGAREVGKDEALGLNCAWYADILMTLTAR